MTVLVAYASRHGATAGIAERIAATHNTATTTPLVIGPLDATQWIGATPSAATLRQLWEQANNAGAIHRHGLYVDEGNRLDRIVAASTTGDTATEKRELDAFIADVTNNTGTIDIIWQASLLAYAQAVRTPLGP